MGDEEKKKPQTKAAVIEIEVSFREIHALYEQTNGRRFVTTDKGPRLVYPSGLLPFYSYANRYDPQYEDIAGNKVAEVKGAVHGMYQGIRITGYGPALRTFVRKHAQKVHDKWIYVFGSTGKGGNGMTLLHEARSENGELQLVDLAANQEKNERKPSGTKRKNFVLTLKSIDASSPKYFWFLLAPYQIPWASLKRMEKDGSRTASRCMRLGDEFYTDVSFDGGEPKMVYEAVDDIKAGKPFSFVLYLIDPFKEGLRRAEDYALAVSIWQTLQEGLGKDDEYVLAKRIHNLPPRYVNVVWNKLGPYLAEKEKTVRKYLRVATMTLEDLMCWIGERHQRDSWGTNVVVNNKRATASSDTWMFKEDGTGAAFSERKEDRAWYNAFSDLVDDYNQADTPEDIYGRVGEVVAAVHSRLEDLPRGQDFLKKIVNEAFREKLGDIAHGGAKLLFEAARKGDSAAGEVVGALLKFYAPKWVEAYKSDALPALVKFMREKHKIELSQIKPSRVRKVEEKLARKAHEKAAKRGIEKLAKHYHLSLEPAKVQGLKLSNKAFTRLAFGIEVFNMKYSISEFASETDFWSGLGLLGSTIDAFSAVAKLYPKLETWSFAYSFGGARKVIKIAPILVVISSAVDSVLAARDVYNSTNFGEGAGHSIRTLGAAMTVGGALAAETGVGVVVAIVGLGLQALGSWIASEFDDMEQFLRHSKWGDASTLDGISNWFSDKNDFGYTGDLDDLHKDINAQLRALDWMFFLFKPVLGQWNGAHLYAPSRITLKVNPPKSITATAVWSAKLDIINRDNGAKIKTYEWQAADELDHAILSSNEEIAILQKENPPPTGQATISARYGKVKIKGEIKLDVFGDGSSYVVRKIDKNMDLSW